MPKGKGYSNVEQRRARRKGAKPKAKRSPKSAAALAEGELARKGRMGGPNTQANTNYGGTARTAAIKKLGKLSKQERAHLKAGKTVLAVTRARAANKRKK
jgi:hypothetical protein